MKNDLPNIAPTAAEIARTLEDALALQRAAYFAHPVPTLAERKADLRTLQRFIRENKQALCDAISADYGHRSQHETLLAEVFPAMDGVSHVIGSLRKWMRPQRRSVDLRNFIGASNRVIPQPLGVVGIIVPWNFPLHLSLIPLTYVFAAGNRAMVKMSENSRHLAAFLIEKMPAYFPPDKLRFFDETGGVGIEFSKLPFDHLLFTGSGQTGRSVMAAAAVNLVPVTLELGGKAPAILCDDFPLRLAAERILFAKLMNAGQICTTVDHAWIPRAKVDEFVAVAREIVNGALPVHHVHRLHLGHRRALVRPPGGRAGRRQGARRHRHPGDPGRAVGPRHAQDVAAHRAQRAGRLRAAAARDLRARSCRSAPTTRSRP